MDIADPGRGLGLGLGGMSVSVLVSDSSGGTKNEVLLSRDAREMSDREWDWEWE